MTATHTPITLAALAMMMIMTTTNQTSEISSLSQKATELAMGLTHWNVTYVVFLGLTVVMSAAALVASVFIVWGNIRLSKVQTNLATAKEGELKQKLADTNERAAKLEKEAADARLELEQIKKRQDRRLFDIEKFQAALKGKPHCDIEIFCQPNDDEAYGLATIISLGLATSGWPLSQPIPIPGNMGTELPTILEPDGRPHKMSDKEIEIWTQLLKSYPPTVRAGAGGTAISSVSFGIFVVSNKDVSDAFARQTQGSDTPQGALVNAFNAVGLNAGVGPANNQLTDSKLRIIVGSKP